jgi:hypothetical protein
LKEESKNADSIKQRLEKEEYLQALRDIQNVIGSSNGNPPVVDAA